MKREQPIEKQDDLYTSKDQRKLDDNDIWAIYNGPTHRMLKEDDQNYKRYAEMLFSKIMKFTSKSQKHSVGYCPSCMCFITIQGPQRAELDHPTHLMITSRKLFKDESISDVESFIQWNRRTEYTVKYKGRKSMAKVVPLINRYHIMTEYDILRTNKEKRTYVLDLEAKIKRLEFENGMLKKRLLLSHAFEYGSPEFLSLKIAK